MRRSRGVTSSSTESLSELTRDAAWIAAPNRHDLIGIDIGFGLLLEVLFDRGANDRQAGRPADENDSVEVAHREPGLLHGFVAHFEGALHEILNQRAELLAGDRVLEGPRLAIFADEDVGNADLDFVFDRQALLGRFGRNFQLLERKGIVARVDAFLRHEPVGQHVEDAVIEVIAAEESVAAGRENLEDVLADLEDRDIEGTAAEVVDRDCLLETFAEAVREGGCRGLVENAQHFESRDLSRVLGGLSLVVVEVGRDGDDGLGDLFVERASATCFISRSTIAEISGQGEFFVADAGSGRRGSVPR